MDVRVLIVIIAVGLCTAQRNVCPAGFASHIHDAFGLANKEVYVQRGMWHSIPCLSIRPDEALFSVFWFRGSGTNDPNKVRLISHSGGTDYPTSDRYALIKSGFSLVIRGVEDSDEGGYLCQVAPLETTDRTVKINVRVIEDSFPQSTGSTIFPASFTRGHRQTLPCKCVPDGAISVVYWSTGEGVTAATEIIAARFSDGAVLQFQHGADYSIGMNSSLTVNSLNAVRDSQRFWCHAFQSDGTLSNCYTDVQISDENSSTNALMASPISFYLREALKQNVPCTNWTPGDAHCEVHWFRNEASSRFPILNYTTSSGAVNAESGFELSDDFGLSFKSASYAQAGEYVCTAGTRANDSEGVINIYVFGDTFPLDGGNIAAHDKATSATGEAVWLPCLAGLNNTLMNRTTVIWSFGAADATTTTVIGTLSLPEGLKQMIEANWCYNISSEGSLLVNSCSQVKTVRYWCHVFTYNGVLHRSYVDVAINDEQEPVKIILIVALCVSLPIVTFVVIAVCLIWRQRKLKSNRNRNQGNYEMVNMTGSQEELIVGRLAEMVKNFVAETMDRLSITPWVAWDGVSYAPIKDVHTTPELWVHSYANDCVVKYKLNSEDEIFNDGIAKLPSKHVLIQGRAGSGKSTILYKLAYDWYHGRGNSLLSQKRMVFVVPKRVLITAGSLGEAVIRYVLPKKTKITAKFINNYCSKYPDRVTIFVDGCNDKQDIADVMTVVKFQGLLNCHLIMTTRHTQVANVCKEHNLRHVIITGLAPENARNYVKRVLDFEKLHGNMGERQRDIHSDLRGYLDEHILPPEVSCLPANLSALCKLAVWTNGDAFRRTPTMTELFSLLVGCMFDKNPAHAKRNAPTDIENSSTNLFPEDQLNVLVEIGKVVFNRIFENSDDPVTFSKSDFVDACKNGETVFNMGTEVGLFSCNRELSLDMKVKEQNADKVPSLELSGRSSRTSLLCCNQGEHNKSETGLVSNDCKVDFTLEIIQQFCAGVFMARTKEHVSTLMRQIQETDVVRNIDKLANGFAFASGYSAAARSALVKHLAGKVTEERKQKKKLKDAVQLEILVELCLQLNFEGKCKGSLNRVLGSLLDEERMRLTVISCHTIRLLSYVLDYMRPETGDKLGLKTIELFRMGPHDWSELQEYLKYIFHDPVGDTDMDSRDREDLGSPTENLESSRLCERIKSGDKDMPLFPRQISDWSVCSIVTSLGVQELLESQGGDCHSTVSSLEFARCLSCAEMIEEIVLVGTILDSVEICAIASKLGCFRNLKKLDFRLNQQINDDAFLVITRSLVRSCEALIDLRVSLYGVTSDGFADAQKEIEEYKGGSWGRLKTLYLLHASPAEAFVTFLTSCLEYIRQVKCFHISCVSPVKVPGNVLDQFEDKLKDKQLVRCLEELVVGNMEELKLRVASLKLPKSWLDLDELYFSSDFQPSWF